MVSNNLSAAEVLPLCDFESGRGSQHLVDSSFQFFSAQPLRPLRLCGELFAARIHRGDAENAELTQRVNHAKALPSTCY
jgi:hypothetical protein